jgi:hypothetical protein
VSYPKANGRAGGLAYYARREPGVLNIFSEYSFKIPRIYSNMLEYTQIYSNISLSGGYGGLPGEASERSRQVGRRTNNPNVYMNKINQSYLNGL